LTFHGWQRDLEPFYRKSSVLVRLVEHDGTGLTAVEALSRGRHVIYSFPLPHTLRVAWGDNDALSRILSGLLNLHKRGLLRLNTAGRSYAEKHYDHERCMEDLIAYFVEIAARAKRKAGSSR
jgi:glycosyltransferase involved in cell wall biosynthesis